MNRSVHGRALLALLIVATSVVATVRVLLPATAAAQNSNVSLVLYNAQHVPLAEAWAAELNRQTGIKVEIRSGRDLELANQIAQEGAGSPADVFITENSPAMQVVAAKNLFAPVDKETLAQVPARFSPSNGDWVGVAA